MHLSHASETQPSGRICCLFIALENTLAKGVINSIPAGVGRILTWLNDFCAWCYFYDYMLHGNRYFEDVIKAMNLLILNEEDS